MAVTYPNSLAATMRAKIRRGGSDRFWTPDDFDALADPLQIDRVLSRLANYGELRKVRRGLYWRGRPTAFGMSRPSTADTIAAVVGTRGVGPAGLSAANGLGLTTQVPALENVAVPHRAPRPFGSVRFVDRSGRPGRALAGLGWTEVALLEVLGDWHHVIEVDDSTARSQLGELIRSGSLRLDKLARAARDEPATVRHRLKNLLAANGYGALAASIPAPRSIARFAHEAAAPS
jgi:hypothetical protein